MQLETLETMMKYFCPLVVYYNITCRSEIETPYIID